MSTSTTRVETCTVAPTGDAWLLDPSLVHLNHGSFGAMLSSVHDAQQRWRARIEADPTGFFFDGYHPALQHARQRLADFLGADPAGLVFVPNATYGIASVLASLERFADRGGALVRSTHSYNACTNLLEVTAERTGANVRTADIAFPDASPDQARDAVLDQIAPDTRLLLIDHVTSPTGLVLPVEQLITECEPDVPVLIDGAHAPGMVPLQLDRLGASFYVGNLHKWVSAPKGSAFLWVAEPYRDLIRPAVISHGLNTDWHDTSLLHRLFDWTGTFDMSAWLTVPDAIDALAATDPDGWHGVMTANHALALHARDLLCDTLGIAPPAPDDMIGAMAAVPLHNARPGLQDRLRDNGIVPIVQEWGVGPSQLLRVSTHRYTTEHQLHHLADVLRADLERTPEPALVSTGSSRPPVAGMATHRTSRR